jgi:hypothetical protein
VGQKRVQLKDQNAILYFRYVVKTNVFLIVLSVLGNQLYKQLIYIFYILLIRLFIGKYLSKHFKPKIVFALYVAYF